MKIKTGLLFVFLIVLLSCPTAWSDSIQVGSILLNTQYGDPGSSPGGDYFQILNLTGTSGFGLNTTDSLTFSNITLTYYSTATLSSTVVHLSDIPSANFFGLYPADGTVLPTNSITSFDFSATIGSSPLLLNLTDGPPTLISQYIDASYSGSALDSSTGDTVFAINANTVSPAPVPEPTTLFLVGIGLGGLWMTKRKRA